MKHILKTDPAVFQAVADGAKTYEIRLNDRGYAVGDELLLRETTHTGAEIAIGATLEYTGREITKHVGHVLGGYGLKDDWVILSFAERTTSPVSQMTDAPDTSQDWAKLDGATAFHLIERHAEDWAETGHMMESWLAARIAAAAPHAQTETVARKIVAWTEKDGDEWVVYDAESDTGQHIAKYQTKDHGVHVFPIYEDCKP